MQKNILYDHSTAPPATNHRHFHRPRIDKMLSVAFNYPVVIVTAGAGWGKTQAVSSFLRHTNMNFIWLKLSVLDNLTIRFWENFIHASGIQNPALVPQLSELGFPYSGAQFHDFLNLFANSIVDIDKLIFTFDDLHLISEPSILHFIENLIWARLKNVTIVLINRTKPILKLHGLYTSNSIYQVFEKNLHFTKEEVIEYFNKQGISLSKNAFEKVYAETEGWILAIYLISLTIKKNDNEIQDPFVIAKRQIFDLIEAEIFSQYSVELQRCLIKLALFKNIPVNVLRDYSTDSLHLADELEKPNLFVKFNPTTKTYDIHRLFLDFLLKKQTCLTDRELKEAHLRIAVWYHNHGSEVCALSHYRECGNYLEIWNIIYHYDIVISIDLADLFLDLMKEFPDSFVKAHPLIPVIHARLLLNNGKIGASKKEFLSIINIYEALPPTKENRAVAGETYLFLAMISLLSYDYKFIEYFKKADAYLPSHSALIDHRLGFSQGNYLLMIKNPVPGEVQKFVDSAMDALPYGVRAMNGAASGAKYLIKAEAAYYTGYMKEAEISSYNAIYQAEKNAQMDIICAAYFILIRVHFNAGNYTKATACMAELKGKLDALQNIPYTKYCLLSYDIMMGWYSSRLGIYDNIPAWVLKEEVRTGTLPPNSLCKDHYIRAYYLLENEKYYELSALVEALSEYYNTQNLLPARLDMQIYKAVAAHKIGDIPESMKALKNAYELSVDNALFMPFIELGKYMRAVTYTAKHSNKNTIPDAWLTKMNTKANTYGKRLNNVKAQYQQAIEYYVTEEKQFTGRERKIIRHLCQGLTCKEIASSLYISTSTAKTALTNIYAKLGASNKADAVRISIHLKLDR